MASESRELYVGVTNNLQRRLAEHRADHHPDGYCFRHRTTRLVYYEWTYDAESAIRREKRLKRLSRRKKFALSSTLIRTGVTWPASRAGEISAPSASHSEASG